VAGYAVNDSFVPMILHYRLVFVQYRRSRETPDPRDSREPLEHDECTASGKAKNPTVDDEYSLSSNVAQHQLRVGRSTLA
jgi:hypothetical protein